MRWSSFEAEVRHATRTIYDAHPKLFHCPFQAQIESIRDKWHTPSVDHVKVADEHTLQGRLFENALNIMSAVARNAGLQVK